MRHLKVSRLIAAAALVSCVFIMLGCGAMRPYSPIGYQGSGGGGSTLNPRFTVAVNPDVLVFQTEGSRGFDVIVTSVDGFSGTVYLSTRYQQKNVTVTLYNLSVDVPANGQVRVKGQATWNGLPPYGITLIGVTGKSNALQDSAELRLDISGGPS
jgi:hypothetical protein